MNPLRWASIWFSRSTSQYGGVPEWPKGADCKSVAIRFGGSNPPSSTKNVPPTGGAFLYVDSKDGSWKRAGGAFQPTWLFRRKANPPSSTTKNVSPIGGAFFICGRGAHCAPLRGIAPRPYGYVSASIRRGDPCGRPPFPTRLFHPQTGITCPQIRTNVRSHGIGYHQTEMPSRGFSEIYVANGDNL